MNELMMMNYMQYNGTVWLYQFGKWQMTYQSALTQHYYQSTILTPVVYDGEYFWFFDMVRNLIVQSKDGENWATQKAPFSNCIQSPTTALVANGRAFFACNNIVASSHASGEWNVFTTVDALADITYVNDLQLYVALGEYTYPADVMMVMAMFDGNDDDDGVDGNDVMVA